MPEFIATLFIIAFSVLLFCYWFRYACLLILSARTAQDYTREVVLNIQLGFEAVQAELDQGCADYARLHASLDKDYEILTSLLKQAAGLRLEDRLMQTDYRLMSAWRRLSPDRPLREMSMVIAYFANRLGEQAVTNARTRITA